ncbi:hypothetical protein AK830_g8756 [Neonectria ditissima]|uniref:Uncharacterized protein n=1 Tax=Neonectria ditissima TaxID=78410 RepID=A0A0N8H627_9HYPO|nr:hypothetical protein AK830_g8756 [Neonectria ditissima]
MEGALRATLVEINDAGLQIKSVLVEELPNRGMDDLASLLEGVDQTDPKDREMIDFLSSPSAELDKLLRDIESLIDRLFNLAMLIRRAGAQN